MKIMLYGGTFDPPHNGHINNLRAALALVRPDRAIVMPAGTPPHKQASTTPAALRLQMCACFTALSPVVEGAAIPYTRWNGCAAVTRRRSCTFVSAAICC